MEGDFDSLASWSGEAGGLSQIAKGCDALNGSLTSAMDALDGTDATDAFDASCNTCKHFQRKPMTPQERSERAAYGMPGMCAKKRIAVVGWHRGVFCGFENSECYENRRTGATRNA